MPLTLRPLRSPAAVLALLTACAQDPAAPRAAVVAPTVGPAYLLAPGERSRTVVDSTDASGMRVMVTEYAAGLYTRPDGVSASVASVTIRTVIPATAGGSSRGACITSTIVGLETTPGWAASVKKPGGCDKEIGVDLANRTTGQKAVFSYLYVAGKTRIDQGAVR